jgi:solute carrier family 13 (sodium-dependent dicarboxylate transporter), member 2/3/5
MTGPSRPRDGARLHLIAGPLAFLVVLLVPLPGMTFAIRTGFGLLLWMVWWWVTGPVHLAVTALLPLVVAAVLDPVPVADLLPAYAGELVILLLGASILAAAWSRWGVDRRVALVTLAALGGNPRRQILVWFTAAMLLSTVLPNTVVAAAMMPVAVAMLTYLGVEDLGASRFGTALGIAIAWGTSVGGVATPLGGAPNLLVVQFVQRSVTHRELPFVEWVTHLFPITLAAMVAALIFMRIAFRPDPPGGEASRDYFRDALAKLGTAKPAERWGIGLFAAAVLLAFTRPLYASMLPGFRPAFAFLTCALLCFVVRRENEPILRWEFAQKHVMWGLLYLFAGGAALGQVLDQTGAARLVADWLAPYATGGGLGAVAIFALLAMAITQVTSNTAAIAITVPITISTFQGLGLDPLPFVFVVAAAGNFGLMLPSSAGGPAVAAGYGVNLKTMFTKGLWLVLVLWVLVVLVGYALGA